MSVYSIKLYIEITTSMSWALPVCVLFTLLMQSVNEEQFLNSTFLLALYAAAPAGIVFEIIIVSLICLYASLQSYKNLTLSLMLQIF